MAEEDKGWRQTTATAWAGRATRLLSPAAARHCAAARERVYLRTADLARWAPRPGTYYYFIVDFTGIQLYSLIISIRLVFNSSVCIVCISCNSCVLSLVCFYNDSRKPMFLFIGCAKNIFFSLLTFFPFI